ncbi:hypothetical protein OV208_00350 [Corallococcus sp. bb12-1]|uniref:hypothetical protein n=1 Tax=Corallococcus sp. bb12-1 TaxID=2996784 RepID=UPI00226DAEAB|nr:hypothetical protein [Corallococcus sp. bb12-1]MCY1039749.1 hypothetical protein [Corallococcus sp. bb12-1]
MSIQNQSVGELLAGYAQVLAELRRRRVVRTNNAPAGDYAEWLVARALGGALAEDNSVKSYDLTLPAGERLQVKARVVSEPPKHGQLQTSAFRSWDFELAALVLLRDTDYCVVRAVLAPAEIVREQSRFSAHTKSHSVHMNSRLMDHARAADITAQLRAAAGE